MTAEQFFIDSLVDENSRAMLERRVAVLRADYVKHPDDERPPFGIWRNRGRTLVLSTAHLSRKALPWFLNALRSFRPDVFWVYPSALSNFLRLAAEAGELIRIPIVLSSSEVMSQGLFGQASEQLEARVIDYYGQAERVCLAYCDSDRSYWFDPAYGHVELIREGRAERANAPSTARIVATGYWNSAFPLIRYETGDRAILPESGDPRSLELIAAGRQPFLGIIGRSDDYVVGRSGKRIIGINHLAWGLESVLQLQVVQDAPEQIRIFALTRDELSADDRRRLERNSRQLLPAYMSVEIESVDQLRTLANGKTPFIIRCVDASYA